MPMSDADLKELKEGMYEVYDELFSTSIEFLPFDPNNSPDDDIYDESRFKSFLDPIILVGRVTVKSEDKEVRETGMGRDSSIKVSFPVKTLEDNGVLNFGEEIILKSRLRYKGVEYTIKNFQPKSNIGDTFLRYVVEGERVKSE